MVERLVQPVSMHRPVSHHTCFVYKTCIFFNKVRFPSFPYSGIVLHHCLLIQVDHFCAHKHTLFGVYILYILAVAMGKEPLLHHELNRNCNINGGHEHARGWKNRLVGEKMTMNGRNSHPEENLGGTFISFSCVCMYLMIWDDCIQYEAAQRQLCLKFCGYWQKKLLLIGATLSIWQRYSFSPVTHQC